MRKFRFRYELAEEIIRRGGTDEEIQECIMKEFPGSRKNPTRAQWYRRSWEKYGHCRGNDALENRESRRRTVNNIEVLQKQSDFKSLAPVNVKTAIIPETNMTRISCLENEWLDYAWSVLTDIEHIRQCEQKGGKGIEDRTLRWPGYLGERYNHGGLLLIANIHRDFASGQANKNLASELVECTRKWRNLGRSEASDREYLSANRTCYMNGLKTWTVGRWFLKFLDRAELQLADVTYLNVARCQSVDGARHSLQRFCLRRFPLQDLEAVLRPDLVLTTSTVVRDEVKLKSPVRWFNQRNGNDQDKKKFDEWSGLALADFAKS